MLEILLQIDKESNSKKSFFFFFFFFGGGGGGGGLLRLGGSEHNVQMFQRHFYSSKNTNVPNCSEIRA